MFTIGEFSKITGLTVKTLRFYHERGLLVPAAVDRATGYRSYDDRNAETARVIVTLRELDFSLEEISSIIAECAEDEDLIVFLEQQKSAIGKRMSRLASAADRIESLIQQQREARQMAKVAAAFEVQERELEPLLVAGVRMQGKYGDCGQGFALLGRRLGRHIAGKPLCLYYDCEYRDGDANFEPCFPVRSQVSAEGLDVRELPGGRCVSLTHLGPYEELGRSYASALRYLNMHGYKAALPSREVYLKGPGMIFRGNSKKYLTEIQILVESP